jgi:SAM-dependent MidA family methyltransferase
MHGELCTCRVQAAAYRGANALRTASHQYYFALHLTFLATFLCKLLNSHICELYLTMLSHPTATLPTPSPEAVQHSARLAEFIRRDIAEQGGWISFARYMELALYAPGLGYYTAGAHKFGEAGDFITAPELSPLFGRTLARQVAEIMAYSAPHILELGAGSGKLAADMLAELEQLGSLPDSYAILEVSADLRARQQALMRERLPHLLDRLHWLDALPEKFSGAIIANEVLDALPAHLVYWRDSAITERGVTLARSTPPDARLPGGLGAALGEQGFIWQERAISNTELLLAAQKISVADNYVSEICLAARGLINSLAQRLEQGALLFIDYGFGTREFYHPQRSRGTLMCHYRHHAHDDPFFLPGLQDITAHVNFTDIAECGIDAGLELIGYTNQAFFLINCGITGLLQNTSPENLQDYLPLSAKLQKLTSPAEMGELFKVIALGKNMASSLIGFVRGDLTRSL